MSCIQQIHVVLTSLDDWSGWVCWGVGWGDDADEVKEEKI
jgi:hypothetical protein